MSVEMNIVLEQSLNGGTQQIYRFDNGYGASVLRGGSFAYGGLELAVAKFFGDGDDDWSLCYTTPITDDVLGYLSEDDLAQHLKDISELPKAEQK